MDFIPEHGKKLTKEEIKSIIEKNNVHFIRLQFVRSEERRVGK